MNHKNLHRFYRNMEERMVRFCELCGDEADLYCDADSAFLCRSCDSKFHASNFLFARHFRRIICPDCKSLTGHVVSGPLSPPPPKTTCCSRARGMTEKRRVKAAASGIFVNWCDKLGLNGDSRNAVVSLASLALAVGKPRCSAKVVLAAAFWVGLRNSLNSMTCPSLNNVEDVTGVAPGIFRPLETKLARAVTLRLRRWRLDSEEGWAENDVV